MKAEIITIGDEILIGQIVDTNSAWLGSQLSLLGVQVVQITSVSDNAKAIIDALNLAKTRAQLILITGGLGPTKDDITKHTLAQYFESKLVTNPSVLEKLRDWFEKRGRVMSEMNAKQADLPHNCEILANELGTAQGMLWRSTEYWVLSMPGVPYEMKFIVNNGLIPLLKQEANLPVIVHQTIMTCGMVESQIAATIAPVEDALPQHIKLAYLPRPGIVRLRLSGKGTEREKLEAEIASYELQIRERLGHFVYGVNEEPLEAAIGKKLLAQTATLGTAESCTGGSIASAITRIPGSSAYFTGSIVSYANEVKIKQLDVSPATLENYGAVSEAVVLEMASGLKQHLGVDYALAVSGVAGPTGGTEEKPVGTVWIAVSGPKSTYAKSFNFGTERQLNIERASMMALYMLWKMLVSN
ncbi:MAG: competence/damage-inducible protein A [Sphingobacteriaceae bacterium]|nr:competence/damage-inducible protein A [Sphingobacteriaceae bacterium]